jgi:glycosyltransferase involved in cell wall biosynthesis
VFRTILGLAVSTLLRSVFANTMLHTRTDNGGTMTSIDAPYLIVVAVPVVIDQRGRRWTDALFAKDLALHIDYLNDLTIGCPCDSDEPGPNDVCLNEAPFDRVKFVDLPRARSNWEAVRSLPKMLKSLWRAVSGASIVHVGFGSWHIPEGFLVVPMGKILKKYVIANVESSPWRVTGAKVSVRRRLRSFLTEKLSRYFIRMADLRLFTSKAYVREFLANDTSRSFVLPATWIDEEWVLNDDLAAAVWDAKGGVTRLMFAGRLVPDKGVNVLLSAINESAAAGAELQVTLIGDGPLRDDCKAAAQRLHGSVRIQYLDPVPYGKPFLELIRAHDAVLLPSLSFEQPRLLFDAFSQAVPVIGSATGGILEVAEPDVTGRLVPPNDVSALALAMQWASTNRAELRALGMAALAKIRGSTHRAMHRNRHEILLRMLPDRLLAGP